MLIAPLMPGINDSPAQVEKILELCAEAGAVSIGGICLHLRGEVRDVFMDWLRSYRPDLVPRYETPLRARRLRAADRARAPVAPGALGRRAGSGFGAMPKTPSRDGGAAAGAAVAVLRPASSGSDQGPSSNAPYHL